MKKFVGLVLVIMMTASILSGCAKAEEKETSGTAQSTDANATKEETPDTETADSQKPIIIKWFQYQIEVAEQIKNMAKAYETEHPNVKIEVEIMGDGYYDILKTKAATNDMPDVFMTGGYNELKTYKDFIYDLTDEAIAGQFVEASKSAISLEGRILGIPVQMSGCGIIYNKKIFEENDLAVPKTYSELEVVCEKLQEKGITPFVNQFKDSWLLGQFLSYGIAANTDTQTFIQEVASGKVKLKDNEMMKNNLRLMNLMVKYGLENPLNDDWNSANTKFAQGKGAMIAEGIWVYDTIKAVNPDMEIGLFANPMSDAAEQSKLAVDVNGVWNINKNSKNIEEVKKIFDWIINSEAGKNFITKECKFIPAYKDVEGDLNTLCTDVSTYINSGSTYIWAWFSLPDGAQVNFGKVYQDHIALNRSDESTLEALNEEWLKGVKK